MYFMSCILIHLSLVYNRYKPITWAGFSVGYQRNHRIHFRSFIFSIIIINPHLSNKFSSYPSLILNYLKVYECSEILILSHLHYMLYRFLTFREEGKSLPKSDLTSNSLQSPLVYHSNDEAHSCSNSPLTLLSYHLSKSVSSAFSYCKIPAPTYKYHHLKSQ